MQGILNSQSDALCRGPRHSEAPLYLDGRMGAWGGRAGRVGGLVGEWMDGCSDGRMMDRQVNHVKNDIKC